MESLYTSCFLVCTRCRHEWTYMGNRLASLQRSRRPVRVQCPQCNSRVMLEAADAQ